MRSHYDNRNTSLLAFLAGVATGGLVVALTTPKSGKDLREDVMRQGRRMKGRFDDLLHGCEDTFDEYQTSFASAGREFRDRAGRVMEDVKDTGCQVGDDLKHGAEQVGKDIRKS